MKTHRITLPAEWHALALRGVSRLLLPMRKQSGSVLDLKTMEARDVRFSTCPYRAGDRLALREPWSTEDGPYIYRSNYKNPAWHWPWQPASRMPLAACRCFYRVASVEPVRISEISEEHARECGFEPNVNGWEDAAPQAVTLWTEWFTGRVPDWAWSVRVEKEAKGMPKREPILSPEQTQRIRCRRRKATILRTAEKSVEAEITTLLQLAGWWVTKTDVIHATVDYGARGTRRIRHGEPGQPDLLAVRAPHLCRECIGGIGDGGPCRACVYGTIPGAILFIEVKAPDNPTVEPHQLAYHEVLRRDGFTVLVARSWADVVNQAAAAGVRVER